jgi:hypothetical protein
VGVERSFMLGSLDKIKEIYLCFLIAIEPEPEREGKENLHN